MHRTVVLDVVGLGAKLLGQASPNLLRRTPGGRGPSLAAAQRARDATLAESLLAKNGDGAVLIAGDGHVRRDLGVPIYLSAAGADRICAVGILEVEDGRENAGDYVRSAALPVPLYDFACFTARWSRPDPCADFQRRK